MTGEFGYMLVIIALKCTVFELGVSNRHRDGQTDKHQLAFVSLMEHSKGVRHSLATGTDIRPNNSVIYNLVHLLSSVM